MSETLVTAQDAPSLTPAKESADGGKRASEAGARHQDAKLASEPPTRRRGQGRPFTSETGREAGKRGGQGSPAMETDEAIERGLRRKAASDPRAAEVLLRWLSRPQAPTEADALGAMSTEALEALHGVAMRLCALPPHEQQALVQTLLRP